MPFRPSRLRTYKDIVEVISRRSTCNRRQVGAILIREGRIIATGYNGSPAGMPHCIEDGCLMSNGHCIRSLHAEASLISYCARNGITTSGASLVVTTCPCYECAKLIINSGIKRVFFLEDYTNDEGLQLLASAGLSVICITGDETIYDCLL